MKSFLIIFAVLVPALASGFPGCHEDEAIDSAGGPPASPRTFASDKSGRFATVTFPADDAQPELRPSHRPPPKKVLVRDLEVGDGPVAGAGDTARLYYYSVDYRTGKRVYFRWPPEPALVHPLGNEPWEKALFGMRVGGVREVVVPSHLLFGTGTVDYVFELLPGGDLGSVPPANG